jgi:zinc and cadmium transporter
MAVAWALTLLAFAGIGAGLFLNHFVTLSDHLSAIGGGVLFGIALFWILPEIAESSGWVAAAVGAIAACGALAGLDRLLIHSGHSPRHGVVGPLLLATAVHSFLDGWSVRAFAIQPVANVAVPLGLALHKVPEGLALGWIVRRSFASTWRAAATAAGVELLTAAGAFIEPRANQSGAAAFGAWWSALVLAIIAGSFLFLGVHALAPARKRAGVVAVFVATLTVIGGIAFLRRG